METVIVPLSQYCHGVQGDPLPSALTEHSRPVEAGRGTNFSAAAALNSPALRSSAGQAHPHSSRSAPADRRAGEHRTAEGPAAGLFSARDDESRLLAALEQVAENVLDLEQRRQQMLSELQQAAVEIALAVAQRLTWNLVDRNAFPVEALVSELVDRLQADQGIEICLNPLDLAQLQPLLENTDQPLAWQHATFVPQPTLARGTCRVEAGKFGLQISLMGLLTEIRKQLLENLADAQIERRRPLPDGRQLRRHPDRRAAP